MSGRDQGQKLPILAINRFSVDWVQTLPPLGSTPVGWVPWASHHITASSVLTLLFLSLDVTGAMPQLTSPATFKHTSHFQSPHGSSFLGVQTLPSCSGKFPTSFKAQGLCLLPSVSLESLPDLSSMTPQPIPQFLGLGILVQKPSIAKPHCQAM